MTDHAFLQRVSATLADLPDVHAVTMGGSRAQGTARPDSDWDLGIYYRGDFDPQTLRKDRMGRRSLRDRRLGVWIGSTTDHRKVRTRNCPV